MARPVYTRRAICSVCVPHGSQTEHIARIIRYAGGSGGKVVRCDALRAPTPRSALPRLQSGRIPEDYLSLRKMWYSYEKNELIYITV